MLDELFRTVKCVAGKENRFSFNGDFESDGWNRVQSVEEAKPCAVNIQRSPSNCWAEYKERLQLFYWDTGDRRVLPKKRIHDCFCCQNLKIYIVGDSVLRLWYRTKFYGTFLHRDLHGNG